MWAEVHTHTHRVEMELATQAFSEIWTHCQLALATGT